jgi:hypothetical protein
MSHNRPIFSLLKAAFSPNPYCGCLLAGLNHGLRLGEASRSSAVSIPERPGSSDTLQHLLLGYTVGSRSAAPPEDVRVAGGSALWKG